ncbi:4-(cytidine 5'-diphospho)-2-C-methyl-D-erythritol kinase [Telmatocola sphagniphila]|uniref:4-diphosphocytidyl-2-C-methyl-D-erythritol kinase n=1 Tax=Telmatocola sphagniphila TaxID=1123043 RepID=A0A8E6B8Q8_9BACT|nr:4-(cytidine 5'-diphospho)-2-C-methyl-D-erythritol kinase [Telmatocola sphagniphila]QVL32598.1 4-(cytidine 5'-diphospho)-2-C-methyl-D-erythritol kinase [Telmatocola sphagniphila]
MTPSLQTDGSLLLLAPAKLNLFLEILGKRPDGYHELSTLMVAINLCDEIIFRPHRAEILLSCDTPELAVGAENLVVKAAQLLRRSTGCQDGVAIHLRKKIPWAAGLGGGSSDAAATLLGLNRLWKLNLSVVELKELGSQLGSDVPFFLGENAAWCTGRGEILEPLPARIPLHLLLLKPASGCDTAAVYRNLKLPPNPRSGQNLREAFVVGDARRLAAEMFNRLQESAFEMNSEIQAILAELSRTSALGCLMSGSGSSLFAVAEDESHSERLAAELQNQKLPAGTRWWRVRSL